MTRPRSLLDRSYIAAAAALLLLALLTPACLTLAQPTQQQQQQQPGYPLQGKDVAYTLPLPAADGAAGKALGGGPQIDIRVSALLERVLSSTYVS
jgi:hypothetical protein